VLTRRAADFAGQNRPDIAALMTEYKALFEQLLHEAAALGIVTGCRYGGELVAAMRDDPKAALN
jgi:hypothetical protein